MVVKTGGYLSEPFEMYRGTRQGCPLSPLLFILFMAKILKDTKPEEADLIVPRGMNRAGRDHASCEGGLYADDLVCLERNVEMARICCMKLYEWGKKWGMELGLEKCGVMLWSTNEAIMAEFDATHFETPDGIIPHVVSYKYLGIPVTTVLERIYGKGRLLTCTGRTYRRNELCVSSSSEGDEGPRYIEAPVVGQVLSRSPLS